MGSSKFMTMIVSILVSVDSVLEEHRRQTPQKLGKCFNPSFCGFGIGGGMLAGFLDFLRFVSILVSVDSVLEVILDCRGYCL